MHCQEYRDDFLGKENQLHCLKDSDSSRAHRTVQLTLIMERIKHFEIDCTVPDLKAFILLLQQAPSLNLSLKMLIFNCMHSWSV